MNKEKRELKIKVMSPDIRYQIMEVAVNIKKMLDNGYSFDDILKYDDIEDKRPCQLKLIFSKEKNNER